MIRTSNLVAASILSTVTWCGLAQEPPTAPHFEAESVKVAPFISGQSRSLKGGPGSSDPGRITYTRVSLVQILSKAYGVQPDQITGPKWIGDNSNLFVIVATMPPDTDEKQFQLMLQDLLANRLHLTLHHETKSFPGYQLTVAKGGPKLKESPSAGDPPPVGRGMTIGPDGNLQRTGPGVSAMYLRGAERTVYKERTIDALVSGLGAMINLSIGANAGSPIPVVVDKTGLTGKYDFNLNFSCAVPSCSTSPHAPSGLAPQVSSDPAPASSQDDPTGIPNLFVALERQLGLKLEKTKDVAVDALVIDHVDNTPTEN